MNKGIEERTMQKAIVADYMTIPGVTEEIAWNILHATWPKVTMLDSEQSPDGGARTLVCHIKPATHCTSFTCALGADMRTLEHLAEGGDEHAMLPVQACTVAVSWCTGVPLDAISSGIQWHSPVPRGASLLLKMSYVGVKHGRNEWRIDVYLDDESKTVVFKNRRVLTQMPEKKTRD